jgi:hypothetical protein
VDNGQSRVIQANPAALGLDQRRIPDEEKPMDLGIGPQDIANALNNDFRGAIAAHGINGNFH